MKTLLIFPPIAYTPTPFLSVPSLVGQLRNAGIDATGCDMNLEFLCYAFTQEYIKNTIIKSEKLLYSLKEKYNDINSNNDNFSKLKLEDKINVLKKEKIDKYFTKYSQKIFNIYKYIEKSVDVMRDDKLFYNPSLFYKSYKIINDAMDLIFLPYSPTTVRRFSYINPLFKYNYEDIKFQTEDSSTNIFREFYQKLIDEGYFNNYDVIGISIPTHSQTIAGLTLARMLKQLGKKVCIGGNIITRLKNAIQMTPEFFDIFCDYISIGDGELSLVSLIKHIYGEIKIEEVTGLIYSNKSQIIVNDPQVVLAKDVKPIDFTGYNLKKYFAPEIVLSIQISKGCYWGKCAFCDFFYGKPYYSCLSAEKAADVIEDIIKRYNIKNFQFEDEALSPSFLESFAKEVLKRNLGITYASYLRLESAFTKDLLSLMYKSGYVRAFWGYEFGSERIMKIINKGINLKDRARILKDSNDAGIWNHISLMYGFPTETKEEAEETLNFCKNNPDIIQQCEVANFTLTKYARALNMQKELNIRNIRNNETFAPDLEYDADGMSETEKHNLHNEFINFYNEQSKNKIVGQLYIPMYLMLYLKKYGKNNVLNTKIKEQ